MKLIRYSILVAIGMALAPPITWGDEGAAGGLVGTVHDFTATSVDGEFSVESPPDELDDVGLCTYCHTPHHALSTSLLWNHTLSQSDFTWDITETTAGTPYPTISGQTYKGATAKCLSCHDGTVAIGDVAWFFEDSRLAADGAEMDTRSHSEPDDAARIAAGNVAGNMAGNHPVAMPYPYNGAQNTYNGKTTGDAYISDEWVQNPEDNGIRLFHDTGVGDIVAGADPGTTGIECSSCHDPHNKQTQDDLFLRGHLTGSSGGPDGYLCLKCHKK